jgi:protein subunit release factor B
MNERKHEVWLQVSGGQGPAECAWAAVVRTVEEIQREAFAASLDFRAVEMMPGPESGTVESSLLSIRGDLPLARFVEAWCGTVQWIARSPFRPNHKQAETGSSAWRFWSRSTKRVLPLEIYAGRPCGPVGLAVSTSIEPSQRSG